MIRERVCSLLLATVLATASGADVSGGDPTGPWAQPAAGPSQFENPAQALTRTEYDDLAPRLEAAERRIRELQSVAVTTPVGHSTEHQTQPPLSWSSNLVCPTPAPESSGEDQEEPKKWYEKFGVRGYTQFRFNETVHLSDGSARPQHAGDSGIGDDDTFLIRRARLILFGDVTDHMYIYFQPDFAVTPPGSPDSNHFLQLRDWYSDIYLDTDKVHRFRVGQSKVPYGWENLQSSSNRLSLDRHDAFNSATRNERDLGIFYYWTPVWAQEMYEEISDLELKHSGNYGVFGFGPYAGQGGSLSEQNDELHLVARLNIPFQLPNGQYFEASIQGFTGRYVVLGSPIRPLGLGPTDVIPAGTRQTGNVDGLLERRIGWSFIWYPQPIGFQAEWTIGRGPVLDATQTAVEVGALNGGYAMTMYKDDDFFDGNVIPYARWQYFSGGYRSFRNAPKADIHEWNFGVEWQIRSELELVVEYVITDRTNLNAISSSAPVSRASYAQFDGHVLRTQLQINY